MAKYRVLSGIDYPPNKRAEAGDVVEDLPPKSVKWLLDSKIIEPADKATADLKVVEVNDDARDGDGDGILQEGTTAERPVEEETPAAEQPAEIASSDEQEEAGE